jgi:hypothetical protein
MIHYMSVNPDWRTAGVIAQSAGVGRHGMIDLSAGVSVVTAPVPRSHQDQMNDLDTVW